MITVSVCIITYLHGAYIKECIDSILAQKTEFKLQIVIADDCSPDNTKSIIEQIVQDYNGEHCIEYHRHEKNIGAMQNSLFAMNLCVGKYVAFCEGDDYWINDLKIQKQVSALESNPDFVLSYSESTHFIQTTEQFHPVAARPPSNSVKVNVEKMIDSKFIEVASSVFPSVYLTNILNTLRPVLNRPKTLIADTRFFLEASILGLFHYLPETTSVYRVLPESASHSTNPLKFAAIKKDSLLARREFIARHNLNPKLLRNYLAGHNRSIINFAYARKTQSTSSLLKMLEFRPVSLYLSLPLKHKLKLSILTFKQIFIRR